MGLKIISDSAVTVYRKDKQTSNGGTFSTYCIGVSSKDKDGNWTNGFIDVAFKKDAVVNNKAKINIGNAFPVVREYNGKKYVSWMITEFYVVEQGEAPQTAPQSDGFMNAADGISEELPFT